MTTILISYLFQDGCLRAKQESIEISLQLPEKSNAKSQTGSTFSSSKQISIGVPHGSVLGPLLFNICINDLFYIEIESEICNFADYTRIYACGTSIEAVMIRLEGDAYRLMKWFTDNGMKANPQNFKYCF